MAHNSTHRLSKECRTKVKYLEDTKSCLRQGCDPIPPFFLTAYYKEVKGKAEVLNGHCMDITDFVFMTRLVNVTLLLVKPTML